MYRTFVRLHDFFPAHRKCSAPALAGVLAPPNLQARRGTLAQRMQLMWKGMGGNVLSRTHTLEHLKHTVAQKVEYMDRPEITNTSSN